MKNNMLIWRLSLLGIYLLVCFVVYKPDSAAEGLILLLLSMIPFILIGALFLKSKKKNNNLLESLGLSNEEELHQLLADYKQIIAGGLYIKDDFLISLESSKTYYLYEITDISTTKIRHRNRNYTYFTYKLCIKTEEFTDYHNFSTDENACECVSLLLNKMAVNGKINHLKGSFDDVVNVKTDTTSDDPYEGMIMDKEDLKDIKDRSDWLGSI